MKGNTLYFVGGILRQVVSFIMLPIYTNYLTASDYGVIAMLMAVTMLMDTLLGTKFTAAQTKFIYDEIDENRRKIINTSAIITSVVMVGVVIIAIALSSNELSKTLFDGTIEPYWITIFSIGLLGQTLEVYSNTIMQIKKRASTYFQLSILKLVLQLLLNIIFIVVLDFSFVGVILSSVISSLIVGVTSLVVVSKNLSLSISPEVIKKLLIFTWPIWLASVSAISLTFSTQYILKIGGGLVDVGLYELASKFSSLIIILFFKPFSQVWQVYRFDILKDNESKVSFQDAYNLTFTTMLFMAVGVALFSPSVLQVMSSEDFQQAFVAIPFLLMARVLNSSTAFFNFSFIVSEVTTHLATLSWIKLAVFLPLATFLSFGWGFLGVALALVMTNIIVFSITYVWSKRQFDLNVSLTYFLFSILSAVFIVLIRYANRGDSLLENLAIDSTAIFALLFVYIAIMPKTTRALMLNILSNILRSLGFQKINF